MKLLHIDSSPRIGSYSRELSKTFVDSFLEASGPTEILRRDLNLNPPPFVDEAWVTNSFLPEDQRAPGAMSVSDELTEEFLSADVVVLGMPMYNFGVPAVYKSWIDQIMRAGRTFKYTETGPVGLAVGKTAVMLISRAGAYSAGQVAETLNHQETYLRSLFAVMGVHDFHTIVLEDAFNGDINYKLTERKVEAARLAKDIAWNLAEESAKVGAIA